MRTGTDRAFCWKMLDYSDIASPTTQTSTLKVKNAAVAAELKAIHELCLVENSDQIKGKLIRWLRVCGADVVTRARVWVCAYV